MKKIIDILNEIDERKREEIVKTYEACLQAICCEEIQWQEFLVYGPSEEMVKNILLSMEAHYMLVICDRVKSINEKEKTEQRNVKICIAESNKKNLEDDVEIWTIKENRNSLLAVITISDREKNFLYKKAES